MAPKKKRGGQSRVTFAPSKMSTRSAKKTVPSPKTSKANVAKVPKMPKLATKATAKKGKAVPKAKKAAPKKTKIEVRSTDSEPLEMESEVDKKNNDEDLPTEPIEQVFLKMDDNFMETTEPEGEETETCEIREQLESLNVEESHEPKSGTEDVNEHSSEESVVEEVIEIDGCGEYEYITEEFVPVVENAEVIIIDDEVEANNEVPEKPEETTSGENIEEMKLEEKPQEESIVEAQIEETNIVDKPEETKIEDKPAEETEIQDKLKETEIENQLKETEIEDKLEETKIEDKPEETKIEEKSEETKVDYKPEETKEQPMETTEEAPEAENKTVPEEVKKVEEPKKRAEAPKAKKKVPKPKEPKKNPPKKKAKPKPKKEQNDKTEEVRRSSRIKSINVLKQRSKGHGLVKSTKLPPDENKESSNTQSTEEKSSDSASSLPVTETDNKPVKVKSRWRRSSELEMNVLTPAAIVIETCGDSEKIAEANNLENKPKPTHDEEVTTRLKQFVHLKENLYLTDRMSCKEAKKMTCDCFLTPEEIERGELGCGEDCLNRLLMIECGGLCPVGDRCTNKKFQKSQFAPVEVFKTEKKGLGLRAAANIPYGEFILEYVGEVLDPEEFDNRADDYSNDKNKHYYFMSLRADAIIDATMKGNISRFINHSCDPNAETQKWTVNGELRIGFFSTRTILAGEEITFDYRFQRYGKEAQKCYCESSLCRGWLGEEPDDEDDEDEEDEEEEEAEEVKDKVEEDKPETEKIDSEAKETKSVEKVQKPPVKEKKKRSPRKKPRKELLEDLDQLDDEIDMLVTTGLKNQAHTLKLSRLMVRAKEPGQRAKLLRVLRRGELPCRRLFLDYHGLRLMHGYMTDAQDLAKTDKKYESLRLEMLQTLATLPIPNKTMLQDSKVLPTVEIWSSGKVNDLPMDSDSSSPQTDQEPTQTPKEEDKKKEETVVKEEEEAKDLKMDEDVEIRKSRGMEFQGTSENVGFTNTHGKELADEISSIFQEEDNTSSPTSTETKIVKPEVKPDEPNYQEEITALALKLLEEWSNLKEVFKIPKKERIEQMKEHEREANRGYIAGLGLEQDAEKKNESRYRILKRYRSIDKVDNNARKNIKLEDRTIANFPKLGKYERRKMFALQVEQREEERRRKQREMWRQHEQHCILLGTDPRLTAPFDPNRGYQCIWNPQIGQWQNYPIQNPNVIFNPQNPPVVSGMNNPNYPYLHPPGMIPNNVNPLHTLPSLPYQEEVTKEEDYSQVKFMGPIPPPVKLPPKWKCAKDKYGRPYYYHIKIRKSQWEPPPFSQPQEEDLDDTSETSSSSDTSSLSSDTTSDESDSDDDLDDSKLLMQVKKQMEKQVKSALPAPVKTEDDEASPVVEDKEEETKLETQVCEENNEETPQIEENNDEKAQPGAKKRRTGLVQEIIISPRTEEDRLQFKEDLKRYKLNKEKLKREKEMIVQQTRKHVKEKRKSTIKLKMREMSDSNSEAAKKVKEVFRSNMATVVVSVLNAYRKPDCKEGRITNTDDFKHLARKLTHFVMLKEMKHIEKIDDLVCTENVKAKAKEYIRKYMSKFGENYQKRNDEPDY